MSCRPALLLALVAMAALAGCESTARPAACPGTAVATLKFVGTLDTDGGTCQAVPDGGISFTGTVAYDSSGVAYLCPDRAEATPLAGQLTGDHLTLAANPVAVTLDACGCPLTVTETLVGDVLRADGGAAGFSGELSDALAPADGGTGCEPDGGTTCGVPCTARWQLTGTR